MGVLVCRTAAGCGQGWCRRVYRLQHMTLPASATRRFIRRVGVVSQFYLGESWRHLPVGFNGGFLNVKLACQMRIFAISASTVPPRRQQWSEMSDPGLCQNARSNLPGPESCPRPVYTALARFSQVLLESCFGLLLPQLCSALNSRQETRGNKMSHVRFFFNFD